jgi:RNA polymerase sigma-70 factor (ECF subfamily)
MKIMTESSSIRVFAERLRPNQRPCHRKVASRSRRGCATPSADGALMERVTQRDTSALEVLHGRYARPVYSLVLRILQEPASAEEIVQDVFLLLWRNAARYRASRGPLEPWLFTLARNRALDYLRLRREKQRRREDSYDFDLTDSGAEANPEALIDGARRAEYVRICLSELPEWQRRSIELAFFGGMTHSEIAAALAEPLGTVKNWIRNGLIRLREALGSAAKEGQP